MPYIDFVNEDRFDEMEELSESLFGKECDYCEDISPASDCVLPDGTERMLVSYDDGTFLGKPFIYERKIKFCPMCGREIDNIKE